MWELPTPLIVANRSQQGDEVYGSYPLVLKTRILIADNNTTEASNNSTEAYTAARIITHAQSKDVKQAHIRTSTLLSYNYYKKVPSNTDPKPAKQNRTKSQDLSTYPTSYLNGRIKATLMLTDYRTEMSSRTSPSLTQASTTCTKRSVFERGVQHYHSYFNRRCLPPAIGEDKVR
ncbi:beta-glucosidase 40-like [Dorcoceras hygrometricum]|uniref:Beta-glucosidase 40-like n=1 Tax=Dorcoceras hygrometricum TaxID=472368 RepID=A0A2Z7CP41_9LAMI|nr:beta-glucosidase 40-like [Dorcoceras hygrometricum]